MKKILSIFLALILLSGCVSRKPKEDTQEGRTENIVLAQDEQDNSQDNEDEVEEKKEEISQYKIRETGFGIQMLNEWEISELPEPMGIMVMRNGSMENSGMIQVVYNEDKEQMENDFEGIFKAMQEDKEIQNYFCDQTEKDGLYRIELEYESVDEVSGKAVLSEVIYQETSDTGLIIASFQFSSDFKSESEKISDSIGKLTTENPLEPKHIDKLS